MAAIGAAYAVAILVVLAIDARRDDVLDWFRDPAELAPLGMLDGSLSLVGSLLWTVAATATLLAAAALARQGRTGRRWALLLATGGLAALLGLDDAFLLHERVLPRVLGVDAVESLVLGAEAAAVLAWLWVFRQELRTQSPVVLVGALAGLGGSVALDVGSDVGIDFASRGVVEEALEMVGQLLFAWWCVQLAFNALVAWPGSGTEAEHRLLPQEGTHRSS